MEPLNLLCWRHIRSFHAATDVGFHTGGINGRPVVEDVAHTACTEYEPHVCLRTEYGGAETEEEEEEEEEGEEEDEEEEEESLLYSIASLLILPTSHLVAKNPFTPPVWLPC